MVAYLLWVEFFVWSGENNGEGAKAVCTTERKRKGIMRNYAELKGINNTE
jgi:hypothetical protein